MTEQQHALADRQEIADLLVRYATAIDRRDWALFATCFTEHCHADYGDIGVWDGVDAIAAYMADAHAPMGHTLHRITNQAITVAADTAVARSYVDALLVLADTTCVNAVGFYDDELVRTADGWRIDRRQCTMARIVMLEG